MIVGALVLALFALLGRSAQAQQRFALLLDIDGAIGPATTEYLRDGLAVAEKQNASLVILRMDTPGGLDAATREIVSDILASRTPVAVFVAPAGARAASAGTYILYASHLAAMAPGTHLGAATPVQLGGGASPLPGGGAPKEGEPPKSGGPPDAMTAKVVNDAAAYISSLAALNGRNAEWAERAVREAATLTAEQALAARVVELRAADVQDLLTQADGRRVRMAGRDVALRLSGAGVRAFPATWRIRALAAITDPNIAYLLLLVGVYGLLFEFMSPGGVGPGVFGALALVVGLFALNLLPVNYAGLALLLLGVGLMTLEAAAPSFGVLGVGGVTAFALGSLFLFKGPIPEFRLAPGVVLAAAGLSLAYFTLAIGAVARARHAPLAVGVSTLHGAHGRVLTWAGDHGLVQVQGEDWQARAASPLVPGQVVQVVDRHDLILTVEPAADSPGPTPMPSQEA